MDKNKEMDNIVETKKTLITRFLHYNMAVFGGFLACYAVMLRSDFLGNAQTANLLYLVVALIGKDVNEFILRVFAVLIYVLAAVLYVIVKKKTSLNIKYVSIAIDIIAALVLAVIPENANSILALYPIFFAMSFQWNSFPGSEGYTSSTIFSTNNLRQASLSFGEFLCDKDEKHLHKMFFFLGSLAGFHLGVFFSYFAVKMFRVQGVWFGLIPIITACAINLWEEKMIEEYSEKINTNYSNLNCKSA